MQQKMKITFKKKITASVAMVAIGALLVVTNYINLSRPIKIDYSQQVEMNSSMPGLQQDLLARAEAQEVATVIGRISNISLSSYQEIQEARELFEQASGSAKAYIDEKQLLEVEIAYAELEQQRADLLAEAIVDGDIYGVLEYASYDVQYSGNEYLDSLVQDLIDKATDENMSRSEKLKACYDYMVLNYEYGYNYNYSYGNGPKSVAWATAFLRDGYGACNNWSSAFLYVARALGYDVDLYYGSTANSRGGSYEHYWPVFHMDGTDYIFDPQVEHDITKKTGVIRYMRFGLTGSQASAKYFFSQVIQ